MRKIDIPVDKNWGKNFHPELLIQRLEGLPDILLQQNRCIHFLQKKFEKWFQSLPTL